jgi:predicted TIM-barrel fold metal-dependent hydrolase
MESPDDTRQLLAVFEWAQAERTLLFASDYPHFDFDSPDTSLPPLPEAMRRRVFSENAREVFKLPQRATVSQAMPTG